MLPITTESKEKVQRIYISTTDVNGKAISAKRLRREFSFSEVTHINNYGDIIDKFWRNINTYLLVVEVIAFVFAQRCFTYKNYKLMAVTLCLVVVLVYYTDFFAIRPTDYSKANEGEDFDDIW